MMRCSRSASLAAVAAALCLLSAGAARAQGIPGAPTRNYQPPVKQRAEDMPGGPPPAALPGATSTYAPAERTALDLPPTEALFDSINRGDIASARDAISRGADLSGHNILGMSPLELSVDLSRNDITFLLLSLRGSNPASVPGKATATGPGKAATTVAATTPVKPSPAAKPTTRLAVSAPSTAPSPGMTTVVPRQYGDAGTPNPQAGFLGFAGSVR